MGYNNEFADSGLAPVPPIIFDIETAPIADAADYLEPATAPANYKDPEKIAAYIAEATAAKLEKAALDLDLCRVVAVGFHLGHPEVTEASVFVAEDEGRERDLLAMWWELVGTRMVCGFNCLAFDLPILLRRSLYLGVPAPSIELGKYRHPQVIDLMQRLSYDGLLPNRSLAFYTKRFRLDVPADETTGADIGRFVAACDWDAVREHCRVDVLKTRALAQRLGVVA